MEDDEHAMRCPTRDTGLTIRELIIVVAVGVVLIFVVIPEITCGCSGVPVSRVQMTVALSNMKQLQVATEQMALDGENQGKTNPRWPGDSGGTFTNWTAQLVPAYLSTNDFCKLMSVAGHNVLRGNLPAANTNGMLIYAVSANSPTNTVFLCTANVRDTPAGLTFDTNSASLFSGKGFVVFHKGGDGAVLLPKQITNSATVGSFVPLCR